ncbi:MAG: TetR family transcriptional regulator [Lachnospiraceae bacterium]|jgi:TetR/AcrR family transcriptional regulator|nr:TetR family transcriptional regulator [Lachnospiraceae bacterium]
MNEKFYDLKKEKQDRMINAALKIFAQNGYRHASTDDIIVEAGISKGLLFHYFESKIGLYEFVFGYASRFVNVELTSGVNKKEKNYFSIQRQMAAAEVNVERLYPYVLLYLDSVMRETSEEALSVIADSRSLVSDCVSGLLSSADPVPADCALLTNMIDFTKHGLLRAHVDDPAFDPEALEKEIDVYLDYLERLNNGTEAAAQPTAEEAPAAPSQEESSETGHSEEAPGVPETPADSAAEVPQESAAAEMPDETDGSSEESAETTSVPENADSSEPAAQE